MFESYLKLIARHFTWLERRFPKFMFANRYSLFKTEIAQLLITPGMVILIFLPLLLVTLGIFSLPISGGMQGLLLLVAGIVFFIMLLRVLIRELKKETLAPQTKREQRQ